MAPTARPTVAHPLSPHLQIYRWTWTMLMSILNRVTGAALYGGTILVVVWLVALASGQKAYDAVAWFFGSWIGLLILFGYTWALLNHLLGGLRHFVWDTGRGFGKHERMALSRLTLIASIVLTLAIWAFALLTH